MVTLRQQHSAAFSCSAAAFTLRNLLYSSDGTATIYGSVAALMQKNCFKAVVELQPFGAMRLLYGSGRTGAIYQTAASSTLMALADSGSTATLYGSAPTW